MLVFHEIFQDKKYSLWCFFKSHMEKRFLICISVQCSFSYTTNCSSFMISNTILNLFPDVLPASDLVCILCPLCAASGFHIAPSLISLCPISTVFTCGIYRGLQVGYLELWWSGECSSLNVSVLCVDFFKKKVLKPHYKQTGTIVLADESNAT